MKKLIASKSLEVLDAKLLRLIEQNGGIEIQTHNTFGHYACENIEWFEPLSPNISELHISRAFELRDKGFLGLLSEGDWGKFYITDKGKIALENFDIANKKERIRLWLPILISILSLIISMVALWRT
jgi:hypothetical protein